MNAHDALLFLDLDKGPSQDGPLFDEPKRRLQADPRLRAGYSQFQALRALAWECAPEPGEKLVKQALMQSRREQVKGQLARAAGSEDLAREILLGKVPARQSLPAWFWGLLLLGALALGGLAWRDGLLLPGRGSASAGSPPSLGRASNAPLPFEFPASPPVDAALSEPSTVRADADSQDVRQEDAASREARLLMRQHLKDAEERLNGTDSADGAALTPKLSAPPRPASPPSTLPSPVPTSAPTPRPESSPGSGGTALAADAAGPTAASPSAMAEAAEASMSLSTSTLSANGTLRITVNLPEKKDLDLRLFSKAGQPVRLLASGPYGPGRAEFDLSAFDDTGAALPAGTYYLRVMTAWFSRVETIQIQP